MVREMLESRALAARAAELAPAHQGHHALLRFAAVVGRVAAQGSAAQAAPATRNP